MATSIGEGAARGIEAGFGLGQRFIDQRQREEDRKAAQALQAQQMAEQQADRAFQRERLQAHDTRLAAQDARQARMDQRQLDLDAEQALGQEFNELQAEGKGLLEQYGDFGKVPKDLGDSYAMRVRGTRARLNEARGKRYAPLVEAERSKAQQLWSRIQTGQIPLEQVDDAELVKSLTALARRDIRELMPMAGGIEGGPSMVQQAGMDFMVGAETGNDDMMLNAANVLFKPELMTGVGGPGRDGSEIVSKKIVQLVPHPEDPNQFTPLLEIKVRREDGKVGTYRAPVTENRSADPDDNIKTLSIKDGLERVGQLTTLAEALNQRGIIEKLANGLNTAGQEPANFLEAYYATGGQKPQPKKVDIGHFEKFGDHTIHFLPDGRQVRIEHSKKASGDGSPKQSAEMRELDAARTAGIITPEEHTQRKRDIVLGVDKKTSTGSNEKKAEANDALSLIAQAREILPQATGSYVGRGVDEAARAFGISTGGAENAAKLRAIEGALVAKMPKMSGPQSDKDVQLYRQQAALIGDDTLPASTRLAALEAVEEIQRRYAGIPAADPTKPAASTATPRGRGIQPGVDMGPSRVPARQQAPAQISSKAEFDALPSGATFIAPDGTTRRKP